MRKFKHESSGIEIFESCAEGFYRYFGNKQNFIPKEIIENSKDWVEIFEPKFKNGDVAETYSGAIFLITDVENNRGYGFSSNRIWFSENNLNINLKNDNLKLSTSDKWLEALTKEAVKRGYNSNNFKCLVAYTAKLYPNPNYILNENRLYYGHENNANCVMKDGLWAEVVKEETLEELVERFYKFNISNQNTTYNNYKTFFTKNKETIHRLSK